MRPLREVVFAGAQPEHRLMASVAAGREVCSLPRGTRLNGSRLVELGSFHKVLPEVAAQAEQLERAAPGTIADLALLRSALDGAQTATERLISDTRPALAELSAELPLLLAKGAQLGGHAALPRVMRDIDVFVHERDVEKALRICKEHGFVPDLSEPRQRIYRQYRGQFALVSPSGASLDLHWWLNNNPLHSIATEFTLERVFARSDPGSWQGIAVRFPAHVDAVLLNAMFMFYQHWGQFLRPYLDHARLLRNSPIDELLARASDVGTMTLLAHSARATARVTRSVSPELLSRLRTYPAREPPAAETLYRRPAALTRIARYGLRRRVGAIRYLLRVVEYERVLALTDERFYERARSNLSRPSRELLSRLYLRGDARWVRYAHPLSVLLATATRALLEKAGQQAPRRSTPEEAS